MTDEQYKEFAEVALVQSHTGSDKNFSDNRFAVKRVCFCTAEPRRYSDSL